MREVLSGSGGEHSEHYLNAGLAIRELVLDDHRDYLALDSPFGMYDADLDIYTRLGTQYEVGKLESGLVRAVALNPEGRRFMEFHGAEIEAPVCFLQFSSDNYAGYFYGHYAYYGSDKAGDLRLEATARIAPGTDEHHAYVAGLPLAEAIGLADVWRTLATEGGDRREHSTAGLVAPRIAQAIKRALDAKAVNKLDHKH